MRPATHQVDDVLQEIRLRVQTASACSITTLTKRMAEQLTDYLSDNGVKVRYLHIGRGHGGAGGNHPRPAPGAFDVLVGINLLREGLDIPEVSLVAILDADKEGFLRAERSLIQTIGRAARHLPRQGHPVRRPRDRLHEEGHWTKPNAGAPSRSPTTRRMALPPRGIVKRVRDLIDGVYSDKAVKDAQRLTRGCNRRSACEDMSEKDLSRKIKRLEKQMLEHARNLEFEQAARVRDQTDAAQGPRLWCAMEATTRPDRFADVKRVRGL